MLDLQLPQVDINDGKNGGMVLGLVRNPASSLDTVNALSLYFW